MNIFTDKNTFARNWGLWLPLLTLLFIFSACAGQAVVEVENTPTADPTPEATVTVAATATPSPAQPGELTVDVAVSTGEINPMVYGANYGP
jgi:hypothetical protein